MYIITSDGTNETNHSKLSAWTHATCNIAVKYFPRLKILPTNYEKKFCGALTLYVLEELTLRGSWSMVVEYITLSKFLKYNGFSYSEGIKSRLNRADG